MTAAGLVATAALLGLLLVRERVRLPTHGGVPVRGRALDRAVPPAMVAWGILVAIQLADYLR